jgi:hypothetical protein
VSLKEKSDMELEEIIRENPRSTKLRTEAEFEQASRRQKQARRPARTQVIVAGILTAIALLAYLRAC